jgi:hypothetical protein
MCGQSGHAIPRRSTTASKPGRTWMPGCARQTRQPPARALLASACGPCLASRCRRASDAVPKHMNPVAIGCLAAFGRRDNRRAGGKRQLCAEASRSGQKQLRRSSTRECRWMSGGVYHGHLACQLALAPYQPPFTCCPSILISQTLHSKLGSASTSSSLATHAPSQHPDRLHHRRFG